MNRPKLKISKWLLFIIFINIIIRLPSLLDPVYYGDECIYLTLGQALRKGLVFYRDIHDNKPPLLYFMAALAGGQQNWFRFITITWTSINIFFIYKLAEEIFTKKHYQILASGLFLLFSFLPEGRIANGENFMIMPFTVAVWLLFKYRFFWWAGILASLAFLFKIPIVFDFIAVWLALFIYKEQKLEKIFQQFKKRNIYVFSAAFILPIAISIFYYSIKGAFTPYVRSALMQNIGYLSSWGDQSNNAGFLASNQGLVIRGLIVFGLSLYLFWRRKNLGFKFTFFALWFIFALFGVLLSERPYPHYFIELAPSAAFLLTLACTNITRAEKIIITAFLFSLFFLAKSYYHFWSYPLIPYYQNFASFVLGGKDKSAYFAFFGSNVESDYQIASYIKTHTSPNDRIFVWGNGACIYALSDRLPPGKYTVNYHIYDFNGYDETIKAINQKEPKLIIKLNTEQRNFPALEAILNINYLKSTQIMQGNIYQRVN